MVGLVLVRDLARNEHANKDIIYGFCVRAQYVNTLSATIGPLVARVSAAICVEESVCVLLRNSGALISWKGLPLHPRQRYNQQ